MKEVNPNVEPVSFKENEKDEIEVEVHQVVEDMKGNILADEMAKHVYIIEDDLIKSMEIKKQ